MALKKDEKDVNLPYNTHKKVIFYFILSRRDSKRVKIIKKTKIIAFLSLLFFFFVYKHDMGWAEAYRKTRFDHGMCSFPNCPNKRVPDRKKCRNCLDKLNEREKKRRQNISKDGLCVTCKEKEYLPCFIDDETTTYKRCQTCYLKIVSTRHFGFPDYYQELLDMLEKQNFRCAYTGEIITLGVNDSLDHIIPRNKCPQKACYIKNVHWTTRDINTMKNGLDEPRFLNLCQMVALLFPPEKSFN